MKRLVTALAGVGLVLALTPPAVTGISWATANTATSLLPLNDGTQLETRAVLDCHRANGSCDFTVGADRKSGDGVTGLPNDLWSRQSTDTAKTPSDSCSRARASGRWLTETRSPCARVTSSSRLAGGSTDTTTPLMHPWPGWMGWTSHC